MAGFAGRLLRDGLSPASHLSDPMSCPEWFSLFVYWVKNVGTDLYEMKDHHAIYAAQWGAMVEVHRIPSLKRVFDIFGHGDPGN